MSLLTDLKTMFDASELRFSTGYFDTSCKNRLRDSDDYIAVIPLNTIVRYADDSPAVEEQYARIIIYTPGSWTSLGAAIFWDLMQAGIYVTDQQYGGYDETDHRHAYNIDVAGIYPSTNPNESEES